MSTNFWMKTCPTFRSKILLAKLCVLSMGLPVIMWILLVQIGQIHLLDTTAYSYHRQLTLDWRVYMRDPTAYCRDGRLIAAEKAALADVSWNPFHEFANWNTDYLARQPLCKDEEREK